ncbi:hypothetical protein RvY_18900-1 [Ramazzottius varieornatus]|uniref:Uncharacterized protein n=1 Tax=Ramazzottius varieornatus TaxID=947166 RepID=A0A1D1W8V1_RAMVA|nr:hypothetical protein RvY_18900-1 [Ramazzottius varieornatus]
MGKAAYQDGISAPRHLSVTSKPSRPVTLPSARQVSTALSRNKDAQSPDTTFMLVQFAQFIAHDISNSTSSSLMALITAALNKYYSGALLAALVEKVPDPNNSSNSVTVQCCLPNANTSPNCPLHPSCFPISIPANDRVFGRLNITCMEFTRSKPAPVTGCALSMFILTYASGN